MGPRAPTRRPRMPAEEQVWSCAPPPGRRPRARAARRPRGRARVRCGGRVHRTSARSACAARNGVKPEERKPRPTPAARGARAEYAEPRGARRRGGASAARVSSSASSRRRRSASGRPFDSVVELARARCARRARARAADPARARRLLGDRAPREASARRERVGRRAHAACARATRAVRARAHRAPNDDHLACERAAGRRAPRAPAAVAHVEVVLGERRLGVRGSIAGCARAARRVATACLSERSRAPREPVLRGSRARRGSEPKGLGNAVLHVERPHERAEHTREEEAPFRALCAPANDRPFEISQCPRV